MSGCRYSSSFAWKDRLRHELYIDTGDGEQNMAIHEQFHNQREQLEAAYGRALAWEDLPAKRACRIADYHDGCSVLDRERHDEYIDWFLDAGVRLRQALEPAALKSPVPASDLPVSYPEEALSAPASEP